MRSFEFLRPGYQPPLHSLYCLPHSYLVGKSGGIELSIREARRFSWEELSAATKNFSEQSLIGVGKFGEVYKGLLTEGVLVAIKKRPVAPTQEFVEEVMIIL